MKIVFHRFIGSGIIRRCDLVGGSVSLGVGFEVSNAQARPSNRLSETQTKGKLVKKSDLHRNGSRITSYT